MMETSDSHMINYSHSSSSPPETSSNSSRQILAHNAAHQAFSSSGVAATSVEDDLSSFLKQVSCF